MKFDMVIYHGGCNDGFTAAWLFWQRWPEATFVPAQFYQDPPDVKGRRVAIVDFSYKRDVLVQMADDAEYLIVLDHHESAQKELDGLAFCTFDMEKSGALLAYEYLDGDGYAEQHRLYWSNYVRLFVAYVQDRDLWQHRLPDTREVNASLKSRPQTFQEWNDLSYNFGGGSAATSLVFDGRGILRYQQGIIDYAVKNAAEVVILGHKVLAVNSTVLQSEIGEALAKDRPFGVTWFEKPDGTRVYSMRSQEGGVNVSEIARKMGGGGHVHAAGFSIKRDAVLEIQ